MVREISKSNEQDLWIERVRGLISYLVLTSNFEHFRLGFFCTTVQTKKSSFQTSDKKLLLTLRS